MARQLPLPFSSASASFFKLHSSNKPERIMGRGHAKQCESRLFFLGFSSVNQVSSVFLTIALPQPQSPVLSQSCHLSLGLSFPMAGQAAFDFVFKEMIPSATKKERSSDHDEEPNASTSKVSLKWRPAVSYLVEPSDEKGSSHEEPSSSWSRLTAPASVKVEIKNEKGEVQLALEDGALALEDHETPETKKTKDPKESKGPQDKKTEKKNEKKNKKEKDKDDKKPPAAKKNKASEQYVEGASRKKVKIVNERKTFANRTCPPGPEGAAKFVAIKDAYFKLIKHKIKRNKEVGFCFEYWG